MKSKMTISVLPRFSKGQGAIWKGHFSAVNGPSKGHFSAVNGPSKGHFSTVNWRKRAQLARQTDEKGLTKSALEWLNKRCIAQSTLCVGNKKGKTELKAMCDWYLKKKNLFFFFFLVKRAGRHFGFFKRAGRHEKGAGRRALQKKPRQNTDHNFNGNETQGGGEFSKIFQTDHN